MSSKTGIARTERQSCLIAKRDPAPGDPETVSAPELDRRVVQIILGLGAMIVALIFAVVVLIRRTYVYRLQREIDELDRLRGTAGGNFRDV